MRCLWQIFGYTQTNFVSGSPKLRGLRRAPEDESIYIAAVQSETRTFLGYTRDAQMIFSQYEAKIFVAHKH